MSWFSSFVIDIFESTTISSKLGSRWLEEKCIIYR